VISMGRKKTERSSVFLEKGEGVLKRSGIKKNEIYLHSKGKVPLTKKRSGVNLGGVPYPKKGAQAEKRAGISWCETESQSVRTKSQIRIRKHEVLDWGKGGSNGFGGKRKNGRGAVLSGQGGGGNSEKVKIRDPVEQQKGKLSGFRDDV